MSTDLCGTAHAVLALAGSHQQQVAVLVALVVDGPGQADFAVLGRDGEEAAGVDEQAVADWLLLEGDGRRHQEAAQTKTGYV